MRLMCLCFLGLVCTRVVCLLKGFAGVFWFAQALTPLISNCARLHVGLMQQGWFATDCYKLNTYIYIYTRQTTSRLPRPKGMSLLMDQSQSILYNQPAAAFWYLVDIAGQPILGSYCGPFCRKNFLKRYVCVCAEEPKGY